MASPGTWFAYPQGELSWAGKPAEGVIHEQSVPYVGSAIYGEGTRHCTLEENHVAHLGTWAIELCNGSQNNSIIGNHIFDVGAGGIKVGEHIDAKNDEEESCNTIISDNVIHDGCKIYLGAPAVWIGQSSRNLISHNEIFGSWQWGVSMGWTWHYMPPTRTRNNIVEYNHLHHIGDKELGAHAVLYSLGLQPGSTIRYNLIHDISGGSHGICLDGGAAGILVENNIVHHGPHGLWIGNYSNIGNIVQNNIFAFGSGAQMVRHGDIPPQGMKVDQTGFFYRNIYYWDKGVLIREKAWPNFDIVMDYNLYFNASGHPITFLSYSFDEWKEKGMDVHSIIADPLFVNPDSGDFTLKPESPAFKLGFKSIDLSNVGPRKLKNK